MNEQSAGATTDGVVPAFLSGGGTTSVEIRAKDWSASQLGEPEDWPEILKITLATMLTSPQPMFMAWGPDLVSFFNDAYRPILGARVDGAVGRPFAELWSDVWADIEPIVRKAIDGEGSLFENMPLLMTRNGYPEETWWSFSYMPLRDGSGIVRGMLCITGETSIQVYAEQQAEAERDHLWTLSEDMLARASYDGNLSAVNPAWTKVLGWSEHELLTSPYADIIHPENIETTVAALTEMGETGQPTRFENRVLSSTGDWKPIGWTVAPEPKGTYFIAVGRDLTEDKVRGQELAEAQEALRQSQKMEAVGQLTGGLAHDFNNLLAGISGSLELMGTRIAQGRLADIDRYLVAAQGVAKRAAALTHRLLAFSRRQTLEPKPTDVNRLVAGMEELIRRTVGPEIEIETVAKGGLWSTLVDPNQLENALLNLCINARDAMPDGGRITIETANRWLDDRAARERDIPPGQYVSMCVSDDGVGMPADVIDRAFDPFFTTKPIGVGTGLGLSMIYGFARQTGGQVRIYSEVGQGTMVCIYLPRHHAGEADTEVRAVLPVVGPATAGETVLVVDDEPIVRMLVVDVLEELGYTALEAEDGPQGLKIIRSDARIDLLITDVGLPNGMNGRQVADAARELRPGLKVLFVTGYAENAVLSHGHLDPGMHVVTKPFAVEALGRRIKDLIDRA